MLFNSLQFLLFFPVVTLMYYLLPHRWRWIHLLIASCIFYIAFIPIYIFILFFTIIIDYFAGIMIENAAGRRRKLFLLASIIANVGVLAVFKYYNFFAANVDSFLHSLHLSPHALPMLNIILPIGLSFHTFQAMSYTIEVYRGHQKAERHPGIYALYVMFYPQLVAGPIERPQNLLHQFREEHLFDSMNLLNGLRLMLWGFFKKLVIADRLALYVNIVYATPGHFHFLNLIIATLFFSIQIYCDFSGYSDIAIGAARTMGFDLMINFNRPYFSKNIQDFWQRWHISLSTWFRDYVYISLGGSRVARARVYFNVAVVFLVSGLWHGANWTFLIWGALHTIYFLVFMFSVDYMGFKPARSFLSGLASWFFTFCLVAFAWIFFRADSLHDAMLIVKHILALYHGVPFRLTVKNFENKTEFGIIGWIISAVMCLVLFISESRMSVKADDLSERPVADLAFCTLILSFIVLFGVFYDYSFIYFQF